jgi:hypothetical protein
VITRTDDDVLKTPKRICVVTGVDLSAEHLFLTFILSFYNCVNQMVHVENSFAQCLLMEAFLNEDNLQSYFDLFTSKIN